MFYVYLLTNTNDDRIYIGSTSDLKKRMQEHETGQCKFTKPLLPIKLEAYFAVSSETKARELEKFLKCGSGRAFINKRILSDEA